MRGISRDAHGRKLSAHAAHPPWVGCVRAWSFAPCTRCAKSCVQSKLLVLLGFLIQCTRCTNRRVHWTQNHCTWSVCNDLIGTGERSGQDRPAEDQGHCGLGGRNHPCPRCFPVGILVYSPTIHLWCIGRWLP